MNKAGICASIVAKTGVSREQAEAMLSALRDTIIETLQSGEKIQVLGYCALETKIRPAHASRNPRTGETVQVPETKSLVFKAGKKLKDGIA